MAIFLLAAVPVYAQAESPSVPSVGKGEAEKVATIIRSDKVKTKPIAICRNSLSRSEKLTRRKTAKRSMNCSEKLKQWKKLSVPNIWR